MNPAVIGIDMGGTEIKAASFSADGTMIGQWTRETRDAPGGTVPGFAETVRNLLGEIGGEGMPLGLAAPGVAAKDGRSIAFMPGKMHGIEGFDWTSFLQRDQPVPILNDAHAALLGEIWRGAAQGSENVILLTLGTGVGGAIVCDGRLLKGAMGRAGHVGHMSISESGALSIVGTPGAFEPAIGNYSVSRRTDGRFSTTRQLVDAHLAGDVEASRVWLQSVHDLARALSSLINILDPEVILVGGGIALAGDALFDPLRAHLDRIEWRLGDHRARIVPAELGSWAGACGAAWQALQLREATGSV